MEAEALTTVAFEEKVRAQEDQDKAITMAWKFHAFVGYSGDVVNKAQLYNDNMEKQDVAPAPKVIQCLVDYSGKMEKLLKEMRALLQPSEERKEPEPSKRHQEPEPASQLAPPPTATLPVPPPAPATQPKTPESQPEAPMLVSDWG